MTTFNEILETLSCSVHILQLSFCSPSNQYAHDGSETQEDSLWVAAVAGDRSSAPARVRVVVAPVNDEPPRVANSSSVRLWRGGSATITSANLGKERACQQ